MEYVRRLLQGWKDRAHVRLVVWVHPDCDERARHSFAAIVQHALTVSIRSDLMRADAVPVACGPWSDFLKGLEVIPLRDDMVATLLARSGRRDAFGIHPESVNALWRGLRMEESQRCTHTMGLVPSTWLHARVAMTVKQRLSVTNMQLRASLLDENRFLGLDRPARSYDALLGSERGNEHRGFVALGMYQRYLISHEFGHAMGLGHLKSNWRGRMEDVMRRLESRRRIGADVLRTERSDKTSWKSRSSELLQSDGHGASLRLDGKMYHAVMDQQTVNAHDDCFPLVTLSTFDIVLQESDAIGRALAQLDVVWGAVSAVSSDRS